MKQYIKIFSLAMAFTLSSWLMPKKISAQSGAVTYQVFYDQLSPYGQWINDPDYGYVWSPGISGFTPYSTNGYWIYTDYGWTWVSNYSWGWAPFHYGRWDRRSGQGWIWIPDNEWGPAWVYWRSSPGYYGWAPMGYANSNDYFGDHDRWNFVRDRDFGRHDLHNYYISRSNNVTIINNSTIIKNNGPDVNETQKLTGRNFNPVKIESYHKPGQYLTTDKLNIYRPQVEKNRGGAKPAPAKVVDPVNYGGIKRSPSQQQNNPNPANYGGTKQQPAQQKPNPANYGGTNQQPAQQKPNPANYGGTKQQPAQQKPNPANYGGTNQQPAQQKPNPANYGGTNQQPSQNKPNPANYGGTNHQPKK